MLSRLHLQNFTVFADADFQFSPGLNVIVGTNGTGKSHVLKVGYAVLNRLQERLRFHPSDGVTPSLKENQAQALSTGALEKLINIFRPVPKKASELIRKDAHLRDAQIVYELEQKPEPARLTLYASGNFMESTPPQAAILSARSSPLVPPVFIPAKEVFTLGWMLPVSGQYLINIDETYIDLLKQLRGLPLLRPGAAAAAAIQSLVKLLGGEVEEEQDRYYLTSTVNPQRRMEMNMVAEGLRKFGMLQKLLSNGSLTPRATLFWDEPEANLNPALLRQLAEVLAGLARAGFQIILATHSLFLLKQFHILSRAKDQPTLPIRYFGLNAEPGEPTEVVAVDDFELLPDIVALDEELAQADELTILFAQDDAHTDGR